MGKPGNKTILEVFPQGKNATPVWQRGQLPKVGLKVIYLALET